MALCRDHNSKLSMMRIGFLATLVIGSLMCLAGIPAVFMELSGANDLILGGTAMISTTGFAKAYQSRWEARNAANAG